MTKPTPADLNDLSQGFLPGLIGVEILESEPGLLRSALEVRPDLMAPNGYLHAATVVALADTTCGYGTRSNLPDGATEFTTIELKCNFLGTSRGGSLQCESTLVHAGRTTQVWDAVITETESGSRLALFRCTQLLLYERLEA
ncbi:MAG: PaaI family thioesterase [Anaerolineae bacterium]